MTGQEHLIVLLLKVALLADVGSIAIFVVMYSWLAPWWRNRIGRTIIIKDILLIATLTVSILSLFFHFSRLTSLAAAWVDVVLLGAITPVMLWRSALWYQLARTQSDAAALRAADSAGVPGQQEEATAILTQLARNVTDLRATLSPPDPGDK